MLGIEDTEVVKTKLCLMMGLTVWPGVQRRRQVVHYSGDSDHVRGWVCYGNALKGQLIQTRGRASGEAHQETSRPSLEGWRSQTRGNGSDGERLSECHKLEVPSVVWMWLEHSGPGEVELGSKARLVTRGQSRANQWWV